MATESLARLHWHSHGDSGDGGKPKTLSGGLVGGTDTPAAGSYSVVTSCGLGCVPGSPTSSRNYHDHRPNSIANGLCIILKLLSLGYYRLLPQSRVFLKQLSGILLLPGQRNRSKMKHIWRLHRLACINVLLTHDQAI